MRFFEKNGRELVLLILFLLSLFVGEAQEITIVKSDCESTILQENVEEFFPEKYWVVSVENSRSEYPRLDSVFEITAKGMYEVWVEYRYKGIVQYKTRPLNIGLFGCPDDNPLIDQLEACQDALMDAQYEINQANNTIDSLLNIKQDSVIIIVDNWDCLKELDSCKILIDSLIKNQTVVYKDTCIDYSIQNLELDCKVSIFPNPVKVGEILNIELMGNYDFDVRLFGDNGKLVRNIVTKNGALKWQIKEEGLYYISIRPLGYQTILTKKIIVNE